MRNKCLISCTPDAKATIKQFRQGTIMLRLNDHNHTAPQKPEKK